MGPVYDGTSRSAEMLASAVIESLRLADEKGVKSLSLPAVSTGIFGYPLDEAAQVMLSAAIGYLEGETQLERVVFCLYGQQAYDAFMAALSEISG